MITLAFGQMLFFLATSLAAYGGDDGMTLASRSRLLGTEPFRSDVGLYYSTLTVLGGIYFLLRSVVASRFGRVLRGAKENVVRVEAIGFHPFRYQLSAYVLSGMVAGLAGFLLANQAEFVSPAYMTWQRSGELIFIVILGGLGSLHGAIVGAAAFLILEEYQHHGALEDDLRAAPHPRRALRARGDRGSRTTGRQWLTRCCGSRTCARRMAPSW
jgi:branched-chain amino acid transport system permease protein